ncbi:MAG: fumarylacetoacetate hydrolase family protein [Bacteroidia bacterium]|nr:fumarylacetoacetate hydrolase family protein [Bacteroidia bacterium]
MKAWKMIFVVLCFLAGLLAYYLLRPLSEIPQAANFSCLEMSEGSFISRDSLPQTQKIYGMGLTYSQHLIETASEYDPHAIPPIFRKKLISLASDGDQVKLPSHEELLAGIGELEVEVAQVASADFESIDPMLDYEVELGFVLLEGIDTKQLKDDDFVPKLGYFISNDLSARSLALLGEGSPLRYEYWGISKSYPAFLPLSDEVWIPNSPSSNSIPCIRIETYVNGEQRQSQSTDNMIFTPLQMLRFIHKKYPDAALKAGDMVLTGTPGGVAIATPRALVRLGNLLGFDRYRKLSLKMGGDLSAFLKVGDKVEIRGEGFAPILNEIIEE